MPSARTRQLRIVHLRGAPAGRLYQVGKHRVAQDLFTDEERRFWIWCAERMGRHRGGDLRPRVQAAGGWLGGSQMQGWSRRKR